MDHFIPMRFEVCLYGSVVVFVVAEVLPYELAQRFIHGSGVWTADQNLAHPKSLQSDSEDVDVAVQAPGNARGDEGEDGSNAVRRHAAA